jgi:hypothetical protein
VNVHQVGFNFNFYKMHSEYIIKYIDAHQARQIYKHRNIKVKLQKTNAAIWFNKICRAEKIATYIYKHQSEWQQ